MTGVLLRSYLVGSSVSLTESELVEVCGSWRISRIEQKGKNVCIGIFRWRDELERRRHSHSQTSATKRFVVVNGPRSSLRSDNGYCIDGRPRRLDMSALLAKVAMTAEGTVQKCPLSAVGTTCASSSRTIG